MKTVRRSPKHTRSPKRLNSDNDVKECDVAEMQAGARAKFGRFVKGKMVDHN
jgi:hypothetical protein